MVKLLSLVPSITEILLLPIMQMDALTNGFVVAVCMNLWLCFHSIQLFPTT